MMQMAPRLCVQSRRARGSSSSASRTEPPPPLAQILRKNMSPVLAVRLFHVAATRPALTFRFPPILCQSVWRLSFATIHRRIIQPTAIVCDIPPLSCGPHLLADGVHAGGGPRSTPDLTLPLAHAHRACHRLRSNDSEHQVYPRFRSSCSYHSTPRLS